MRKLLTLVLLTIAVSSGCHIPKKGKPVCGTNGQSFTNLKALECHNEKARDQVAVAYTGRCHRPEVAECNYVRRSKPVCGHDGLTYLNAAMVACKNKLQPAKQVKIMGKGSCNATSTADPKGSKISKSKKTKSPKAKVKVKTTKSKSTTTPAPI